MVYKISNIWQSASAISIVLLLTNISKSSATEYVFTAPPEVKKELVEIPSSEEEYPLYECELVENDILDSHDCICTDCEDDPELAEPKRAESNLENDSERE